jgi:hypothetical protein
MRKFFIDWRIKYSLFTIKFLEIRKLKLQKALLKIEEQIYSIVYPSVSLAASIARGNKNNPPKEKLFKTFCPKCYRYFFIEPSKAMLKGYNIAYANCSHCNQELVSFASPELETGKVAISWLRADEKRKKEELFAFVEMIAERDRTKLSDVSNNNISLQNYYKQILDSSNSNGLIN